MSTRAAAVPMARMSPRFQSITHGQHDKVKGSLMQASAALTVDRRLAHLAQNFQLDGGDFLMI